MDVPTTPPADISGVLWVALGVFGSAIVALVLYLRSLLALSRADLKEAHARIEAIHKGHVAATAALHERYAAQLAALHDRHAAALRELVAAAHRVADANTESTERLAKVIEQLGADAPPGRAGRGRG